MDEAGAHQLPVVADGPLVGVLNREHLLAVLRKHLEFDARAWSRGEALRGPLCSLAESGRVGVSAARPPTRRRSNVRVRFIQLTAHPVERLLELAPLRVDAVQQVEHDLHAGQIDAEVVVERLAYPCSDTSSKSKGAPLAVCWACSRHWR